MNADPKSTAAREAFETFLQLGAHGRDWAAWSKLFTDDALYIEHCMGVFEGPAGIENYLRTSTEAVAGMTFSPEWHIVDGDKVAFWIWNHLPTPPGIDPAVTEYCFPNLTLLTHAGGQMWSCEEDFYEAAWTRVVFDWFKAGGSSALDPQPWLVPHQPSHPSPPEPAPERHLVAAAMAANAPEGSTLRYDVVEGSVGVGVFDTPERAYAVVVHVDQDGAVLLAQVVCNSDETTNKAL